MSKQKALSAINASERGLKAFHGGRLDETIAFWTPLAKTQPRVASALAEAYFRRALSRRATPEQQLKDLQSATDLAPNDAIYQYHLGLAYHRRKDYDTALLAYQLARQAQPTPRGLSLAYALAVVESNPQTDVSQLSGLTEREQALLSALSVFLQTSVATQPQDWWDRLSAQLNGADSIDILWRGLLALQTDALDAAQANLATSAPNLPAKAAALRHYYLGVLAARRNDLSTAQGEWHQAQLGGLATAWLRQNLAAFHLNKAVGDAQAERWGEAAQNARLVLQTDPQNALAREVALVALDRLAHAAAAQNDWVTASQHWATAKNIYAQAGLKGLPQLLCQNLAIAYEAQEMWEQAGEVWRELARSKPRSKKVKSLYSDAQWEWIRKRSAETLRQADRPEAAIELLKKEIKANPNDIDKRLALSDLLMANEQDTAARNQLRAILKLDPKHTSALIKSAELHALRAEWYAAARLLQDVQAQASLNETQRERTAQLQRQAGAWFHQMGMMDMARQTFHAGLKQTPNDPDFYIALARLELDQDHEQSAREHFAQALKLNPRRMESYVQIVESWSIEQNIAAIREIIAQGETQLQSDKRFYLLCGVACLIGLTRKNPSPFNLFGLSQPPPAPAKKTEPSALETLTHELLEHVEDVESLRIIITTTIERMQPHIGMRYAERLRQLTPDDVNATLMLGLLQGLNEQKNEAKQTLQLAARQARQQGLHDLENMANDMRREIGNPMFGSMLGMMPLLGSLPPDALDNLNEDFLDELDDFSNNIFPPSRRRKK